MPNHFYTEPGCAACVEAKKFLISRGIPFEERDIRANPDYLRILTDDLDSRTTPTLVLADKIIVGFDPAEYELLAGTSRTKPKKQAIRARTRSQSRIA
jgi:glutaredoxin